MARQSTSLATPRYGGAGYQPAGRRGQNLETAAVRHNEWHKETLLAGSQAETTGLRPRYGGGWERKNRDDEKRG